MIIVSWTLRNIQWNFIWNSKLFIQGKFIWNDVYKCAPFCSGLSVLTHWGVNKTANFFLWLLKRNTCIANFSIVRHWVFICSKLPQIHVYKKLNDIWYLFPEPTTVFSRLNYFPKWIPFLQWRLILIHEIRSCCFNDYYDISWNYIWNHVSLFQKNNKEDITYDSLKKMLGMCDNGLYY